VHYVIGTDEAGYGPNLGPLVVSATVWQVPDGLRADDLYRRLGDSITVESVRPRENGPARIPIADSKVLYHPGSGLRNLERGLLSALAVVGRRPATWREIWDVLAPESKKLRKNIPWYADYDGQIPIDVEATEIVRLADSLRHALEAARVRLLDIRCRAVFPEEFNRLLACYGTKGAALSHVTLALAARLVKGCRGAPVSVVCDKHGGRNRYGHLVAEYFPEWLIEIHGEGRAQSVYRFGPSESRFEIRFRTKAEACLPVALASMASKYLRELAMKAFNTFWRARISGLRPTAGYPQDARRFRNEIAPVQAELGIEDSVLWRMK
jgi:hypothetical protein